MRSNAILAFSAGYNVQQLEPFVASWRRQAPSSKLLIFYTNTSSQTMQELTALGVDFVDIEHYWPSDYRGITLRFFMWRDYVQAHIEEFEKIMVADIRDIIFQSDPFDQVRSLALTWASEDKTIRSDPEWNYRWLVELFGAAEVEKIADQLATCCGSTAGDAYSMLQYLNDLCNLIESTVFDRGGVYEQGFHNYLVHAIRPSYGRLDPKFNLFGTIGTVSQDRIRINADQILVDDATPSVIHQWDRHPRLVEHISTNRIYKL